MNRTIYFLLGVFFLFQACNSTQINQQRDLKLWYEEPAQKWVEALPVGNGRLGAMVFGGPEVERIQLNEESLWSGGPIQRANPEALENLDKVRQLLFDGKYAEGDKLAQEKIMGTRIDGGKHTYQTLGDLFIEFEGVENVQNYKRELDLRTAVTTTEFEIDGVLYKREVLVSAPDELIAIKLSASEKGKLNFKTWLERPGDAEQVSLGENQMIMTGFAEYEGKGTRFASVVSVQASGGELAPSGNSLRVAHADEVEIRISGRTNYWKTDEVTAAGKDIKNAESSSFNEIKEKHISAYQELFNRVDLTLNEQDTLNIPTDERLERVKEGETDSHLTELYFAFGRYLLQSQLTTVLPVANN